MPFGLAALAPDAADAVIAAHPEIDRWVIGGHSLGGAMAAQYASGHDDVIDGLVLWAAYPAEDTDLSAADLAARAIYASADGLATTDEIDSLDRQAAYGRGPRRDRGRQPRRLRLVWPPGRGWRGDDQPGGSAGADHRRHPRGVEGRLREVTQAMARIEGLRISTRSTTSRPRIASMQKARLLRDGPSGLSGWRFRTLAPLDSRARRVPPGSTGR